MEHLATLFQQSLSIEETSVHPLHRDYQSSTNLLAEEVDEDLLVRRFFNLNADEPILKSEHLLSSSSRAFEGSSQEADRVSTAYHDVQQKSLTAV